MLYFRLKQNPFKKSFHLSSAGLTIGSSLTLNHVIFNRCIWISEKTLCYFIYIIYNTYNVRKCFSLIQKPPVWPSWTRVIIFEKGFLLLQLTYSDSSTTADQMTLGSASARVQILSLYSLFIHFKVSFAIFLPFVLKGLNKCSLTLVRLDWSAT